MDFDTELWLSLALALTVLALGLYLAQRNHSVTLAVTLVWVFHAACFYGYRLLLEPNPVTGEVALFYNSWSWALRFHALLTVLGAEVAYLAKARPHV
jgi:hypothetical protein